MITELIMYAATCDNCGEEWEHIYEDWYCMSDINSLVENMEDWHFLKDDYNMHYCPKCSLTNDKNQLQIINMEKNSVRRLKTSRRWQRFYKTIKQLKINIWKTKHLNYPMGKKQ